MSNVIQFPGIRPAAQAAEVTKHDKSPEAERLRVAVLALEVPETGLTVSAALDEICELFHEVDEERVSRANFLSNGLEKLGLHVRTVNPELGLAREAFLSLMFPRALLAEYPELAGLHPQAHPFLTLG